MSDSRFAAPDGGYDLLLPQGWEVVQGEEGDVDLHHPEGAGTLSLVHFAGEPDAEVDPADELYAFLAEQEIEIQEEEVEDVLLDGDGELAYCEYGTEGDEGEEDAMYWLTGVAVGGGGLVFVTYTCPAGEEAEEIEVVRRMIGSLRIPAGSGA